MSMKSFENSDALNNSDVRIVSFIFCVLEVNFNCLTSDIFMATSLMTEVPLNTINEKYINHNLSSSESHYVKPTSSFDDNDEINFSEENKAAEQYVKNDEHTDEYDIYNAVISGSINRICDFINATKDVNVKNEIGATPLDFAVVYNRMNAAVVLLDNGANPNSTNVLGQCSMHIAAENNNLEMLKLLEKYGGNIHAKSKSEWSVMHSAALGVIETADNWNVIKWLLGKGADPCSKDIYGSSIQDIFNRKDWSYAKYYDELLQKTSIDIDGNRFDVEIREYMMMPPKPPSGNANRPHFQRKYKDFMTMVGANDAKDTYSFCKPEPEQNLSTKILDTLARLLPNSREYKRHIPNSNDVCMALFIDSNDLLCIASNMKNDVSAYAKKHLQEWKEAAAKRSLAQKDIETQFKYHAFQVADEKIRNLGTKIIQLPGSLPGLISKYIGDCAMVKQNSSLGNQIDLDQQLMQIVDECFKEFKPSYGSVKSTLTRILRPFMDVRQFSRHLRTQQNVDPVCKAINNPNGFKIIMVNIDNIHAEMKVLQQLYSDNKNQLPIKAEIGLSKLCCGACNLAILELNKRNSSQQIIVRGTHAKFYESWNPPDWLLNSPSIYNSCIKLLDDAVKEDTAKKSGVIPQNPIMKHYPGCPEDTGFRETITP